MFFFLFNGNQLICFHRVIVAGVVASSASQPRTRALIQRSVPPLHSRVVKAPLGLQGSRQANNAGVASSPTRKEPKWNCLSNNSTATRNTVFPVFQKFNCLTISPPTKKVMKKRKKYSNLLKFYHFDLHAAGRNLLLQGKLQ